MEDIELDKEELMKQFNNEIYETGHYIEAHILIGEDDGFMPMLKFHDCNLIMVSKMYKALDEMKKEIEQEHPDVKCISKLIGTDKYEL